METIVFLQVVHTVLDDRVYYHQRQTLVQAGHKVSIVSALKTPIAENIPNLFCLELKQKSKLKLINEFKHYLERIKPNIIICDNPMSIVAAKVYQKTFKKNEKPKIVYDITEFYPSKKNLYGLNRIAKVGKSFLLKILNMYVAYSSDAFLFGEYYKAQKFIKLFKSKPYLWQTYYPLLSYIKKAKPKTDFDSWIFSYNGNLTAEKGFYRTLTVVKKIAERYPKKSFKLKIVCGNYVATPQETIDKNNIPQNLTIEFNEYMPFQMFCNYLADNDLYFDLRDNDKENTKCLPIKLFYYMAASKPMVFSRLKAIEHKIGNFYEYGQLVDPNDEETIVRAIAKFIDSPSYYTECCKNVRLKSETSFNWEAQEKAFLEFIDSL